MTSLRHIEDQSSARDGYLDAARDCILDVGWRRTTLTEVARRAGVSRMTIYRTWSDMPELLGDLMTREWTAVVARAARPSADRPSAVRPSADRPSALTGGVPGAVQELVEIALRTAKGLRENELFVRIVELDPELLLPYLLARRGRSQQAILDLLVERLEAGQAAGAIRKADPEVLARALLLTAHGFVLSAHTMVDDHACEEDLDAELATILTRALLP